MSAPFLPHPQASPDVLRGALGRGKPLERNLPEPETVGPRRGAPGKNYPKRLGSAAGQHPQPAHTEPVMALRPLARQDGPGAPSHERSEGQESCSLPF